jgi:predicted neuraminidase
MNKKEMKETLTNAMESVETEQVSQGKLTVSDGCSILIILMTADGIIERIEFFDNTADYEKKYNTHIGNGYTLRSNFYSPSGIISILNR